MNRSAVVRVSVIGLAAALFIAGGIVMARASMVATPAGVDGIKPFRIHFPDETLAALKRRVAATRWPDKEVVADQRQGVKLAAVHNLADSPPTHSSARQVEASLQALPQFTPEIDGVDIHFIHVRSK